MPQLGRRSPRRLKYLRRFVRQCNFGGKVNSNPCARAAGYNFASGDPGPHRSSYSGSNSHSNLNSASHVDFGADTCGNTNTFAHTHAHAKTYAHIGSPAYS